jgi:tetratricopeptide (TPR) repeat protein
MIKKILLLNALLFCAAFAFAQAISTPPSGNNQKSEVSQWIGLVKVTINYNSPDVHGPNGEDRKGKIWGGPAHYGYIDQGYGTSKAAPWRAGSNENTTISFSHDVKIGGKKVEAGTYGLFLDVEQEKAWTWILSKDYTSWGSYYYDPENDAVRVEAKLQDCEYTEWLTYSFDNRQPNTATAYLQWENKRAGFAIDVPNANELYISTIEDELRGTRAGFQYEPHINAAVFSAQNKVNLEQGLKWAEAAISHPFFGQENFQSLSVKAQVLTAMNKEADADAVMGKAIKHQTATVQQIHQYGRSLLAAGKTQKALEVFQYNTKSHPNDKFTPSVGLARAYTAVGDKKNAIKYWELAIKNLPENQKQNVAFYEGELKKLKG